MKLLLLLSRFSRAWLHVIPQTAAHQAPPSLGFSRQEHWSGLPFPSPMCESEVAQSCPTLSDPMDCSLQGSSIHGIFQARVLERGAIAFCESEVSPMVNRVHWRNWEFRVAFHWWNCDGVSLAEVFPASLSISSWVQSLEHESSPFWPQSLLIEFCWVFWFVCFLYYTCP